MENLRKLVLITLAIPGMFFLTAQANASGDAALGQLKDQARRSGIQSEIPFIPASPPCISVDGEWAACQVYRNFSVPDFPSLTYSADKSSSAVQGAYRPPRQALKLADYYQLESTMKNEFLRYYADGGEKEAAMAKFAGSGDTRIISDGKTVYLVNGGRVIEVRDAGLSAVAGKVMAGARIKGLDSAVGCAKSAGCWDKLGGYLDAWE